MAFIVNALAKWQGKIIARDCAKYGIYWHDLLMEGHPVHDLFYKRMSAEEMEARKRRIRRMSDLAIKHEAMPAQFQKEFWTFEDVGEKIGRLRAAQKDIDEQKHLARKWWLPYHIATAEAWWPYRGSETAWFWNEKKANPTPGTTGRLH